MGDKPASWLSSKAAQSRVYADVTVSQVLSFLLARGHIAKMHVSDRHGFISVDWVGTYLFDHHRTQNKLIWTRGLPMAASFTLSVIRSLRKTFCTFVVLFQSLHQRSNERSL